jgi:hypothetical protein
VPRRTERSVRTEKASARGSATEFQVIRPVKRSSMHQH